PPNLSKDDLLEVRVRRRPLQEQDELNSVVAAETRQDLVLLQWRNFSRPFLLTGPTFEERLRQFEKYLESERLFSRRDIFFVEPATRNKDSDLFVVRPFAVQTVEQPRTVFRCQDDPEIYSRWRSWFWDQSELENHHIFNSLVGGDELPTSL